MNELILKEGLLGLAILLIGQGFVEPTPAMKLGFIALGIVCIVARGVMKKYGISDTKSKSKTKTKK